MILVRNIIFRMGELFQLIRHEIEIMFILYVFCNVWVYVAEYDFS